MDGQGTSVVGPDLTDAGSRLTREMILESIVKPNAKIAKGYETVTLLLEDGRVISGIISNQTHKSLVIRSEDASDGAHSDASPGITVPVDEIEERMQSKTSSMPEGLGKQLTLHELRDLIEYLSTRRSQSETKTASPVTE